MGPLPTGGTEAASSRSVPVKALVMMCGECEADECSRCRQMQQGYVKQAVLTTRQPHWCRSASVCHMQDALPPALPCRPPPPSHLSIRPKLAAPLLVTQAATVSTGSGTATTARPVCSFPGGTCRLQGRLQSLAPAAPGTSQATELHTAASRHQPVCQAAEAGHIDDWSRPAANKGW